MGSGEAGGRGMPMEEAKEERRYRADSKVVVK